MSGYKSPRCPHCSMRLRVSGLQVLHEEPACPEFRRLAAEAASKPLDPNVSAKVAEVQEVAADLIFDERIRSCTELVKELCDDLEKRTPTPERGLMLGGLRAAWLILEEVGPRDPNAFVVVVGVGGVDSDAS